MNPVLNTEKNLENKSQPLHNNPLGDSSTTETRIESRKKSRIEPRNESSIEYRKEPRKQISTAT